MTEPTTASVYEHGESSSATTEPKWFTSILEHEKAASTKPPVMYSAPRNMKVPDRDNHVFVSSLVSIGPTKGKKPPPVDDRKNGVVFSMLKRHGDKDKRKLLLTELVDEVRKVQEDARGYYFQSFQEEEDFVQVMVIDGCFILEIFRAQKGLHTELSSPPFFASRWGLPGLAADIVKLENQLPYFVLKLLYDRTKRPGDPTLKHLAASFLDFMCPGLGIGTIEDDRHHDHLLSLFHSMCIHSIPIGRGKENRFNSFPSVTDLCISGIKVVKKQKSTNLLEIKYKNGKLEIPTLVLDHNTKILMRNMVAYEQWDKKIRDVFTSYVTFLGALVNSAEDVEVLRVAGVITHFMNSNEEVSALLSSLTANIKLDMNKGYLAVLNAQIYRDYSRTWTMFKTRINRHLRSQEGKGHLIAFIGVCLALSQIAIAVSSYVLLRNSKS